MNHDSAKAQMAPNFMVVYGCANSSSVCIYPARGIAHQAQEEKHFLADGVVIGAKRPEQLSKVGRASRDPPPRQIVEVAQRRPPAPQQPPAEVIKQLAALVNGSQCVPRFRIRKNAEKSIWSQGDPGLGFEEVRIMLGRLQPPALQIVPSPNWHARNTAAERLRLMTDGNKREVEISYLIRRYGQMNILAV